MKKKTSLSPAVLKRADESERISFIAGRDGEYTYFNKAWLEYRGTSLNEECTRQPGDFLHPDDVKGVLAELKLAEQRTEPFCLECRVRGKNKNMSWFRFIVSPLHSSRGLFLATLAHGEPVSQSKRWEEDARRFAAVMAAAKAGIIIKDSKSRILDWSPGAQRIMGYTREEVLGKTSDVYTCKPNLKSIADVNARLVEGQHTSFIRTEVNHKDGHLIICSTSFSPVQDADGNFNGSVVIFHDVTAEKQEEKRRFEIEEELKKSYQDMAGIFNEISAPLCAMSEEDGSLLGCNAAFADMCATSEEAILGNAVTHYFQGGGDCPGSSVTHFINKFRSTQHFVCRLKKQNGELVNVEVSGRSFHFRDQNAFAIHCIDLTKRQQEEQALRETVLAAEEASKMKSVFLANMSHEIRTPLNGVVGFAELALDEPDISDVIRNYLNKIKISASSLLEIINDVLDISKIEAGRIDLEKAPFDLHTDILQVCETIMGDKARERGVVLYFYSEPLVSKKFVGDQTRLRQIILNLLSNAIKFTNVGIVKVMLNVEERNDDSSTISFEIKDSGIGMTPEQIQRIFDPFTQADSSTTRKYGGTGLGLTITKNLIELMGGTLQVESAAGIGSRFSFSLTFETITDNAGLLQPRALAYTSQDKPQFNGEVLVCEDNVINQQVIEEHLVKVGFTVTVVPNGKMGVEQVKLRMREGQPFDLILMDIHMPIMDGLEATQKLHELGVTIPIIALTANAMSTDRKKYMLHGMSDYLAKPFKACDLWDCLRRHLKTTNERALEIRALEAQKFEARALKEAASEAYTEIFLSSQPQETVAIVDRDTGIENAAGNATLYQRLLGNFLEDNKDAVAKLVSTIDSGEITIAYRMMHTLKSVSATIGAMKLSQLASELESALADKKMDIVKQKIPLFSAMLDAVLCELATLEFRHKSNIQAKSLDRKKALDLVRRLEPLLLKADLESLEYLDAVATVLFPIGEKGQQLASQIDDYDFELALATLHVIKAELEAEYE